MVTEVERGDHFLARGRDRVCRAAPPGEVEQTDQSRIVEFEEANIKRRNLFPTLPSCPLSLPTLDVLWDCKINMKALTPYLHVENDVQEICRRTI